MEHASHPSITLLQRFRPLVLRNFLTARSFFKQNRASHKIAPHSGECLKAANGIFFPTDNDTNT
jgi:hypothetical protein